MDEGTVSETVPDLKDIEVKIGRKTPEGLLRWMREEASSHRGDAKTSAPQDAREETGMAGSFCRNCSRVNNNRPAGRPYVCSGSELEQKEDATRQLKEQTAHLRSVDVKLLQQLLVVHEGIEAVKWLMEERSTLTSRCSSLTSSQYSLGDTSWRGSWSSLQDPNDRLDNISIGSYLDTLADDM
uniref:Leucine rich adaptor protein 1 n=1 Tax=Tetraodon nigroviridis TaxID=99883 RepID=H3DL78_TETNG